MKRGSRTLAAVTALLAAAATGGRAKAQDLESPLPRGPAPVVEVTVKGQQRPKPARDAAEVRLASDEVRRVPGAFGDAFRALEVVPGVVPFAAGLPYFFVRGATPAATGYFVDGIRVPYLFHVAVGPAVINPALLDGVELFPGGYPARYGRFIGGIVAATTSPPAPRMRGEATIRVFDAGAFLEAPLADGRANAFAGGRYSYTAAALPLFAPDLRLAYWDYQAGGGYRLVGKDRLSLLAFGSYDHLGRIEEGKAKTLFGAEFHRVELRFDHGRPRRPEGPFDEPRVRLATTFGIDGSALGDEGTIQSPMAAVRADAEVPLDPRVLLRGGADMTLEHFEIAEPTTKPEGDEESDFHRNFVESFAGHNAGTFGGYADIVWRPIDGFELVPGLRADVFGEEGAAKIAVDPRAALRVKVLPNVTSVGTAGVAHQRPSLVIPIPGLEPKGLEDGVQESVQLSQGVEVTLPRDISASLTVFHHTYFDLSDLITTCSAEVRPCSLRHRSDGRAYGVEASVSRSLSKQLGGLVSYTLSRSERVFRTSFTADSDRTHVLHVVLGYAPAPGWHAGVRLSAYSGRPYSLLGFDDPDDPNRATLIGKRNALRRSWFHRVDVRLERRWRIGERGWISLVLEGMNITLQKETVDFDCRVAKVGGGDDLNCGGQEIGPITVPSIGVSGGF